MRDWYDAPQVEDALDEQAERIPNGPLGVIEPSEIEVTDGLPEEVSALVSQFLDGLPDHHDTGICGHITEYFQITEVNKPLNCVVLKNELLQALPVFGLSEFVWHYKREIAPNQKSY